MEGRDDAFSRLLASGRSIRVGILLYPEVEVLDFAGPFEVFSVAARIAPRLEGTGAPVFEVATVGRRRETIRARHGLEVLPRHGFDDAPTFDLYVVPGGVPAQPLADPVTLAHVEAAARDAILTASVCTGAFVLARLGLLDGRRVTTHWEDVADLRSFRPWTEVIEGVPFVDEGGIVTSAGISAGIAMSLHLVGRILGVEAARRTARQMQYDWAP